MTWYALRAAHESVAATRHLLAGASPATWARLSVLVLFAGGLTTPFLVDFNYGSELLDGTVGVDPSSTAVLAAGGGFVGLAALLAGAIAEFVLLDALRGDPVRLVARGRRWFHAGVQLFVFRLVVLCLLALVGLTGIRADDPGPAVLLALALVAGTIVVLDRVTVAFVVPIVFVDGRSLPAGWRAFLPTLRAQWHQYVGYLLVAGTLGFAIAILGGLLAALVAIAFAVPFSAFGAVVAAALIEQGLSAPTVGRVVVLALAAPYLAVVLGSVLLVHVAPVAYLRYVSLFVLGDTTGRYDPIPQVRAAVRRGGSALGD
ncbi:DUF7544 domain-containing protein [Halalkalicoccus salilacus]|uniref:DUF7544 domain-containing protein n=1 Tax=Halalkalicoccus salilacus TaxID=3117459 RepID=UPI00300F3AFA